MDEIVLSVPLMAQPTWTSCWAAALGMVVSYRDGAQYTLQTVADRAGMSLDETYHWSEIQHAIAAWGLVEEAPSSGSVGYWTAQLQQHGPIWVVQTGDPFHAVVVTGIFGDDFDLANVFVNFNNPAPVGLGAEQQLPFAAFEAAFELGAGALATNVHA